MDTFFTIYFIIVGGLFLLNLIYKIIRFIKPDGEDWQLHLAEDVLDWCLYLYPIRKQKPLLTLVDAISITVRLPQSYQEKWKEKCRKKKRRY